MSRNAIFTALLALTSGVTWTGSSGAQTFLETRRRVPDWNKARKPGLYQAEFGETITQTTNMREKVTLRAEWWIYLDDGQSQGYDPTVTVNNVIDALDAAISPPPGFTTQTLGGLVQHAFISGNVLKIAGDLDGAGLLTIPLVILVP